MTLPQAADSPDRVTVVRVQAGQLSLLSSVLVRAAEDPALDNTSVPRLLNTALVEAWFTSVDWSMWVIVVDDIPVGYIALHAPQLTENAEAFEKHIEADTYLFAEYRGRRVVPQAWALLKPSLPLGAQFVAEIWEDNAASIRCAERAGWVFVGRYYWQSASDPADGGWCRRYTYSLD